MLDTFGAEMKKLLDATAKMAKVIKGQFPQECFLGGWPHGRVVKFARSALAAQGFAGLNPGCGRGTAHLATLR